MTRVFGVRGELASLRGLKLRRALMTRFEVVGRVLIRIDMQFSVESTIRASLHFHKGLVQSALCSQKQSSYQLSCRADNIRSRSPDASASKFLGSRDW